ncbi:uncharacterized protein LOC117110098 isoform X2 [Anneissia japonica]|uniref:uncharacterized protein LOC117110098 isoform X2 n=1 Tax=Anneissia japonica TaxID=1529436 RepID=UPI00142558A8|nr:uncharacterized protein LOC117110098 isoform X2 [Anneissia japonica]
MSSSNVDEQHPMSKNDRNTGDAPIQLKRTLSAEKQFYSQADTFCLQTKIFEAIEELKIRRDAEKKSNLIETEEHNMQMGEIKKKFNDNLISIKEDKEKHVLLTETAEKEVLKLRDEIRSMLLNKYSLEKRVQELERAIDFQDSSRTSHHSQLADLELKCKQINSQRAAIQELFNQFKQNVESASEFNRKLEYVSRHRQCQIDELELIVKEQRQQLVEARAKLEARPSPGTEMSRMKKQEDTIHKELQAKDKLCEQLLKHVEEIRNDHKKTQSSLSDAHELIDHYVRSKELSNVQEVKYQHLLNDHEVLKDSWVEKNRLCLSLQESITNKEKEWLQREEELNKSLMIYQSKCDDLTKSSGKLEEIKDYYSRMYEESRLSCQVLQESITGKSSFSKCLNLSQTTQTEYKPDELLPIVTDVTVTYSNSAESPPHLKDSTICDDTTNKNNENKGSSDIIHLYNICVDKDVPNLIDRIQSASPELVSYYVAVEHGTNYDANIDQVADKNRTKENTQNVCNECDEHVSKKQDTHSKLPTNNEQNLTSTDVSLKTTSDEVSVTLKTEEMPLLKLCQEPETSENSGRCIPKAKFDLKEVSGNASTGCDKQGHTQTHPDQDNDYVISHKCEINKTDNLDVSNTNECKPHYDITTASGVHQDQGKMSASESPLNELKHVKEIDVVNQCTDNTVDKNVQSKSNMQAIGNFRPMEIDCGSLNTDLVAICQTARSDLNLISQQWEAEKKSYKISKEAQGQSFRTFEPYLKRFINHPNDLLQNKKARFQTNNKSCRSDSNVRNDSSTTISSDFKSQVADTCSRTQLFSDDDEQEELNNREYIANQISRLT